MRRPVDRASDVVDDDGCSRTAVVHWRQAVIPLLRILRRMGVRQPSARFDNALIISDIVLLNDMGRQNACA